MFYDEDAERLEQNQGLTTVNRKPLRQPDPSAQEVEGNEMEAMAKINAMNNLESQLDMDSGDGSEAGGSMGNLGSMPTWKKKEKSGGGGGGGMMGGMGGMMGGGGGGGMDIGSLIGMFSDQNLKINIQDAKDAINQFLDSLEPKSYIYKDEKHGNGRHISVMAQDLEKTELGDGLVVNTPDGKFVNYGKGFGLMMATMADMHRRLKALESK